jgi:hypothetical protein
LNHLNAWLMNTPRELTAQPAPKAAALLGSITCTHYGSANMLGIGGGKAAR